MDILYVVLAVILGGLMMTGIFTLGALFAVNLVNDAQDESRYARLREEYYRLAGYRTTADPKPYVPPRQVVIKTPRHRMLPGMNALDRLMKEGKRGTIMWRAGDRNNE